MVKNKKLNLIALILALVCLFATSSAFVVFADTATVDEQIEAAYLSGKEAVEKSKIFGDDESVYGWFYTQSNNAALVSETEKENYLEIYAKIAELAENRIIANDLLTKEFNGEVEAGSLNEVQDSADKYLKSSILKSTDLTPAVFGAVYDEHLAGYKAFNDELKGIKERDEAAFEDYRQSATQAIYDEYKTLIVNGTSGDGNKVVGSYSAEQALVLEDCLACYVTVTEGEEGAECAPYEYGELAKVSYSAAKVVEKRAVIDEIKTRAIKELNSVPKNILDVVYSEYLNFIALDEKYKSEEDADKKEELRIERDEALTSLSENSFARVQTALKFYKNATDDFKKANDYSAKNEKLEQFAKEKPQLVVTEYVSQLKDKYGVAEITAFFVDETMGEAKVFRKPDEGGRLELYPSANGAAKRIADGQLKEANSTLSVAYFVNLSVYNGYRLVKTAPETAIVYNEDGSKKTDASGNVVTGKVYYRVRLDLDGYYKHYCAPRGYEQDKRANVENAFSAIKNGDSALCYAYNGGEIEKTYVSESKQTELEGGKLVFYTTSFNDFCVAGTGLENLLTNPWFWLIVLAAVIVLIFVIKAIIKNFRYTIRFITNGGTNIPSLRVAKNEAIVLPDSPTKTGLIFAGWFTDEECTIRFIETKLRRRKGYKLYAKWAAPITAEKLTSYYDGLRTLMVSYEKCSFKPTLGLVEKEMIANMFGEENYVDLYLAIKPAQAKELIEGNNVGAHKNKKLAALPTRVIVSDEKTYADAIKLVEFTMVQNGLQLKEQAPEAVVSTAEERRAGFAYFIKNERVASSMADYFELLRINLKSYVLEEDNGMFKPGDRFTFARMYFTAKNVDLYMPVCKGVKELEKGERNARFSDTPVHIVICDESDMLKAFALVENAMRAYGFTKYPENSNDLEDVALSDTDGFAYTIRF